jgi:hypothetical protein
VDLTVSRPIKILALILVIAGAGGVASMSMLGKSSPASAPTNLSVGQIRARAHQTTTPAAEASAAKPAAKTATKPHTAPAVKAPIATTPAATTTTAVKTPPPTTSADGLPLVLHAALKRHRIVVVSIFDPQSQTDAVSYAEARAGAAVAGVGFLGVSLLDNTVAAPLTAALPGGGLLPNPGLLVYRAPGVLVQRIDGFSDRDSVAQIADSSRTAPAYTPPAPPVAPVVPAPVAPTDTTTTP